MEEKAPKYYLIKKDIIRKIEMEEYLAGETIPSERMLMDYYQVSRITIRKAVDELVMEGYLYKVQGKGTYVKTDENSHDLFAITSCTEDVIKMGLVPTKKVIVSTIVPADTSKAKALRLLPGEKIFRLGRVLYASGEPLNYTVTNLPYKIFPEIEAHDFARESLYETLHSQYGYTLTKARRTLEAVLATDEIAEYLDIGVGMPLIKFGCTTYGSRDGEEIPVERFHCYYRTDKYKFYIDQIASGSNN
jgi:GntR family transcriptional regulator